MSNFKDAIGITFASSMLPIERGKIREFSTALLDDSPVYRNRLMAQAAGLPDMPIPITFPICAQLYSDSGGAAISQLIEMGMLERGFVLHGEQEFSYHRPVFADEEFTVNQKVVDAYQKENTTSGGTMTFFVIESEFIGADARTAFTAKSIVIEKRPPLK
jgi:hypothetical protein